MPMLRLALLDLYNGETNRGIPMLRRMLERYADVLTFDHFDVRARHEVPDLNYDIYIFSGGPGDPRESGLPWCAPFYALIQQLWDWNASLKTPNYSLHDDGRMPKPVLFICHSFQMACNHFGLGEVSPRYKMSFGTYPVHKTHWGKEEPTFEGLPDPFYIADFRRYQVTKPDAERFRQMEAHILCLEKLRPHVHYERALMGVRFSPEMVGFQFHPEADPEGLLNYFMEEDRKQSIIEEHGESRYHRMIRDLANPTKIQRTFNSILPNFLENAIDQLALVPVPA